MAIGFSLLKKTGSGREKIPGWKKKADLFKKMKKKSRLPAGRAPVSLNGDKLKCRFVLGGFFRKVHL